jgi:hypothetical protein
MRKVVWFWRGRHALALFLAFQSALASIQLLEEYSIVVQGKLGAFTGQKNDWSAWTAGRGSREVTGVRSQVSVVRFGVTCAGSYLSVSSQPSSSLLYDAMLDLPRITVSLQCIE